MRISAVIVGLAATATLAACSGATDRQHNPPTTPTSTIVPAATTTDATTGGETPSVGSLRELRSDLAIASIALLEPEMDGPHPILAWEPVDGASSYWLILRDETGEAYWAWSGEETSTRVGGGDVAERNQTAVLHEPMTWSVLAFDSEGGLIAWSEPVSISP